MDKEDKPRMIVKLVGPDGVARESDQILIFGSMAFVPIPNFMLKTPIPAQPPE